MNDLTARLESLLRRLDAGAPDQSDEDAAQLSEQFRTDLQSLVSEYGPEAVNAALDELPDGAAASGYLH
jgi:hypothetical protein